MNHKWIMRCCVWSEKWPCQVASQIRLPRTRTLKYTSARLASAYLLPTQPTALLIWQLTGVMNHDIKQTSGSNLHPLFPSYDRQNSKHGSGTIRRRNPFSWYSNIYQSYFQLGLVLVLLWTLVSCGDDGSYKHDTSGDTALPYKHDTAGDKALPYKHDASGDKGLPYKHDTSGDKGQKWNNVVMK